MEKKIPPLVKKLQMPIVDSYDLSKLSIGDAQRAPSSVTDIYVDSSGNIGFNEKDGGEKTKVFIIHEHDRGNGVVIASLVPPRTILNMVNSVTNRNTNPRGAKKLIFVLSEKPAAPEVMPQVLIASIADNQMKEMAPKIIKDAIEEYNRLSDVEAAPEPIAEATTKAAPKPKSPRTPKAKKTTKTKK